MILSAMLLTVTYAKAQTPTYTTLGIGVTPPQGTLHVHTTEGYYQDEPIVVGNRDQYPYDYYQTLFHITNPATGTNLHDGFIIEQYNQTVTLRQFEDAPIHLKGFNSEGLTLLANGNIGIGTTAPEFRLHVAGTIRATQFLTTGGHVRFCTNSQPLSIGMAHSADLGWGSTYIGFNADRGDNGWTRRNNTWLNGGAVIWATMTGDLLFANLPSTGGDDVSGITDEDIMSAVNMKLSADGVLTAKEVRVTLEGWPDYVFGNGYRLMGLKETEEYIHRNGHLPDVPAASEVEEEGLSVGEMNRILMQKVEELTLHLIELQKQIDELKNK